MFPFTARTAMTQEVYERYSWTILVRRKVILVYMIAAELGILTYGFPSLLEGDFSHIGLMSILAVITPIAVYFFTRFHIKRLYAKNPIWQYAEQEYHFYEDRVIVKNNRGETTYYYKEITEIIDAGQDFYIMLGKNVGLPLERLACSPELEDFILALKTSLSSKKS